MICQIVENGGYMFLILCLFITVASSFVRERTTTIQEFCSDNSYIRNIEPGEPYKLNFNSEKDASTDIIKWYQKSKRKCRHEFKTSSSAAHFSVLITDMNIQSCDDICRCNYFEIVVSGHRQRFCGTKDKDYFLSKSDILSIEFHHGSTLRFDVSLTFSVERNAYIITGTPKDHSDSSNFIETPYFPIPYPPNYKAEYILQSNDPTSHVLLLFLDFQISPHSFIEIAGNNGSHITRFYGNIFRPPVIVSQSNKLTLNFQSNDQPGMLGFRALSSFVKSADSLVVPFTDCAESKDGRGGYIIIKTHERFGLYDCVWHIVPFTPFSKLNLSILTHLRNIGHKSILEFRKGKSSKSEIVKEINCEVHDCSYLDMENIVPASEYLYIRFNGYLDVHSIFQMSYSTYHIGNCSDKEFKCENGRCLLSDFRCDGIPHCPDGSDEEFCPSPRIFEDEKTTSVQSVQRKSLHSDDTYKYFIGFGGFGLLCVVVAILIFIYNRCLKRTSTEPAGAIQTSREITDLQPTLYPVYPFIRDNLPSYDDFVKSSYFYPPLLYTKASQFTPKSPCSQCTTSFCSGARMRHYSADSFLPRNSDTNSGDTGSSIPGETPVPEQSSSPNMYNVEIIQNNLSFKSSKNTVKRSYSLDSKLNDLVNHDSCHLLLSIVHPPCIHDSFHFPQVQWYTLPPSFKYSDFKECNNRPTVNEPSWFHLDSNVHISRDRRFTWSFVPCNSTHSELVTVVKTRCFSEPCKGISIRYSLY